MGKTHSFFEHIGAEPIGHQGFGIDDLRDMTPTLAARRDVTFSSGHDTCAAWLYEPAAPSSPGSQPIIVMAHGLGGTKEQRLDAFADRFTDAGYACLVFDYRHFGASGGQPRQLLDIDRQLEDWEAAVGFARTLPAIDPDRVVAWGTSFGGGHAIVTAARDNRIAAAIAQCPFTDGVASGLTMPLATAARVAALALRDVMAGRLGRTRVMVPTYGPPGSTALMNGADSAAGVEALIPEGAEVDKNIAARFALTIIRHFPGRHVQRISCPIHFAICERDSVAPAKATQRYAKTAPRGEIRLYDTGHFDIYIGEWFERNVADQLAFLARHVAVA